MRGACACCVCLGGCWWLLVAAAKMGATKEFKEHAGSERWGALALSITPCACSYVAWVKPLAAAWTDKALNTHHSAHTSLSTHITQHKHTGS